MRLTPSIVAVVGVVILVVFFVALGLIRRHRALERRRQRWMNDGR